MAAAESRGGLVKEKMHQQCTSEGPVKAKIAKTFNETPRWRLLDSLLTRPSYDICGFNDTLRLKPTATRRAPDKTGF